MDTERAAELRKQIADLKSRWPAHSVPPAMMQQLDALEEELDSELKKQSRSDGSHEVKAFHFRAIGHVVNGYPERTDPDVLKAASSRIVLSPDLVDGLSGLEPGMRLLVVFFFHRAEGRELLQHPRGDQSQPKRGVFALHTPDRPNPIGITEVELVSIEGNVLMVRGLDAIDGTPVLDLKPA